jgi:hypothetical protein
MATETPYTYPGAPIAVAGAGIEFGREHDGSGVEVTVEYADPTWASPHATRETFIAISWEDWDAIVAHVAALERKLEGPGA